MGAFIVAVLLSGALVYLAIYAGIETVIALAVAVVIVFVLLGGGP